MPLGVTVCLNTVADTLAEFVLDFLAVDVLLADKLPVLVTLSLVVTLRTGLALWVFDFVIVALRVA